MLSLAVGYTAGGSIVSVAGGGVGDRHPAISGRLAGPMGLDVTPSRVLIADTGQHRVRQIDQESGLIATLAGSGAYGYSGEGSLAVAARLWSPTVVAESGDGIVVIGDLENFRIRAVRPDGQIVTLAGNGTWGDSGDGGLATAASLKYVSGLAVDSQNNVYFSDWASSRVRRIDSATGVVTTVAGTGTWGSTGDGGRATRTRLAGPTGLAVTGDGDLLIAEAGGHKIRRVGSDGLIDTVAGLGISGFSGDGGLATSSQLSCPIDVDVDDIGGIYIADTCNHRIRRIDPVGVINSVGGDGYKSFDGDGRFGGDGGPALSASLNFPYAVAAATDEAFYVADTYNHRVRYIDTKGSISTSSGGTWFFGDEGPAAEAGIFAPQGVAPSTSGELLIADTHNDRVRRVDSLGIIRTLAGNGSRAFSGDGGQAIAASLSTPRAVGIDGQGTVYIADTGNHRIRAIDGQGRMSTVAGTGESGYSGDGGPAEDAQLAQPWDIDIDEAGNIFIADTANNRIRRVDAGTRVITTIAGGSPCDLTYGDGRDAKDACLNHPHGLVLAVGGDVYISDSRHGLVRRVDSRTGKISTIAGRGIIGPEPSEPHPAVLTDLMFPGGLDVDARGNVYIADIQAHRVVRVDALGLIEVIAGNGSVDYNGDGQSPLLASLWFPTDVAVDEEGYLLIVDWGNDRIRRMSGSLDRLPRIDDVNAHSVHPAVPWSLHEVPAVWGRPGTSRLSLGIKPAL